MQERLHARWGRRKETLINTIDIDRHIRGPAPGEVPTDMSGCTDDVRCLRDSKAALAAVAVLAHVHRALSPGGSLCVLSYEPPAGRIWLLGDHASQTGWRVVVGGWEHEETGNYIYVLQKDLDS